MRISFTPTSTVKPLPTKPFFATYKDEPMLLLITNVGKTYSEGYMVTGNSVYPSMAYFTTDWLTESITPFSGKITITCP